MPQVTIRIPDDLMKRIDLLAVEGERSATLRFLLERGLDAVANDRAVNQLLAQIRAGTQAAITARIAAEKIVTVQSNAYCSRCGPLITWFFSVC